MNAAMGSRSPGEVRISSDGDIVSARRAVRDAAVHLGSRKRMS